MGNKHGNSKKAVKIDQKTAKHEASKSVMLAPKLLASEPIPVKQQGGVIATDGGHPIDRMGSSQSHKPMPVESYILEDSSNLGIAYNFRKDSIEPVVGSTSLPESDSDGLDHRPGVSSGSSNLSAENPFRHDFNIKVEESFGNSSNIWIPTEREISVTSMTVEEILNPVERQRTLTGTTSPSERRPSASSSSTRSLPRASSSLGASAVPGFVSLPIPPRTKVQKARSFSMHAEDIQGDCGRDGDRMTAHDPLLPLYLQYPYCHPYFCDAMPIGVKEGDIREEDLTVGVPDVVWPLLSCCLPFEAFESIEDFVEFSPAEKYYPPVFESGQVHDEHESMSF